MERVFYHRSILGTLDPDPVKGVNFAMPATVSSPSSTQRKRLMEQLLMTKLQAMTSVTVLVSFGLTAQVVAERAAIFDVSKCNCIGDVCTCPDVKGVFFTKAQIDALKAVPKPSKPLEMPDTLKQ
jgi:hypothetical protein